MRGYDGGMWMDLAIAVGIAVAILVVIGIFNARHQKRLVALASTLTCLECGAKGLKVPNNVSVTHGIALVCPKCFHVHTYRASASDPLSASELHSCMVYKMAQHLHRPSKLRAALSIWQSRAAGTPEAPLTATHAVA